MQRSEEKMLWRTAYLVAFLAPIVFPWLIR